MCQMSDNALTRRTFAARRRVRESDETIRAEKDRHGVDSGGDRVPVVGIKEIVMTNALNE